MVMERCTDRVKAEEAEPSRIALSISGQAQRMGYDFARKDLHLERYRGCDVHESKWLLRPGTMRPGASEVYSYRRSTSDWMYRIFVKCIIPKHEIS